MKLKPFGVVAAAVSKSISFLSLPNDENEF
jgi:hypothetical protein